MSSIVDPVLGEPAAVVKLEPDPVLVVADYHAGLESELRAEGVELPSHAEERRERLLDLIAETGVKEVIVLGDLAHWISEPAGAELHELTVLLESLPDDVELRLAKGNHDGMIESQLPIEVSESTGMLRDNVAFIHGNTWPDPAIADTDIICMGHEHPVVRLEDEVGGRQIKQVWLRGEVNAEPFVEQLDCDWFEAELIVFPAFNQLASGTWVNIPEQQFLSPFLPEAFRTADTFLLDGIRLGPYNKV